MSVIDKSMEALLEVPLLHSYCFVVRKEQFFSEQQWAQTNRVSKVKRYLLARLAGTNQKLVLFSVDVKYPVHLLLALRYLKFESGIKLGGVQ